MKGWIRHGGLAAENGNSLRKLPGAGDRAGQGMQSWVISARARDKLAATASPFVVDVGGNKAAPFDWQCFASRQETAEPCIRLPTWEWADPGEARDGGGSGEVRTVKGPRAALPTLTSPRS